MKTRVELALAVMMALALGQVRAGRAERMLMHPLPFRVAEAYRQVRQETKLEANTGTAQPVNHAAERPIVAHIDPSPPGLGIALHASLGPAKNYTLRARAPISLRLHSLEGFALYFMSNTSSSQFGSPCLTTFRIPLRQASCPHSRILSCSSCDSFIFRA